MHKNDLLQTTIARRVSVDNSKYGKCLKPVGKGIPIFHTI